MINCYLINVNIMGKVFVINAQITLIYIVQMLLTYDLILMVCLVQAESARDVYLYPVFLIMYWQDPGEWPNFIADKHLVSPCGTWKQTRTRHNRAQRIRKPFFDWSLLEAFCWADNNTNTQHQKHWVMWFIGQSDDVLQWEDTVVGGSECELP